VGDAQQDTGLAGLDEDDAVVEITSQAGVVTDAGVG